MATELLGHGKLQGAFLGTSGSGEYRRAGLGFEGFEDLEACGDSEEGTMASRLEQSGPEAGRSDALIRFLSTTPMWVYMQWDSSSHGSRGCDEEVKSCQNLQQRSRHLLPDVNSALQ